jgi:tetratricopeptide (TPR) repeat protein
VGPAARFDLVEQLFNAAMDLAPDARAGFLSGACGQNPALQQEVESLLAAYERETALFASRSGDFLSPFLDPEPLAGRVLGNYELLSLIGKGGMGDVYLAQDTRLGRKLAVKILPPAFMADWYRVHRFEQEAKAASALNHPNIVTIHDIGISEIGRYIVMEHVAGRTLRELDNDSAGWPDLWEIATQVARALAVSHAAGIIHRDIKPENIMVRDDGLVKVLDFGLARLSNISSTEPEPASFDGRSRTAMIGTPRYMSPEQARGEPLTPATDIFSFGIVLFEAATGRHPFDCGTVKATVHSIITDLAPRPTVICPSLPSGFETLLLGMLEKSPLSRPCGQDVAAVLSGFRTGVVAPSTPTTRDRKVVVGRIQDLDALWGLFQSVTEGKGLLVTVSGEAGIGKTTLVEQFLFELELRGEPCLIVHGRCSERLAGAEAYLPFLEALDTIVNEHPPLAEIIRRVAPTWYLQVAAPVMDTGEDEQTLAQLGPPPSQQSVKREMAALMRELSRRRPLVAFFDDLHWADLSTIDLISYLATKFDKMPVLIVATFRPADLLMSKHPFLNIKREMQARGLCRELALEFLTVDDVESYVALKFPANNFPAQFGCLIHAKTEGSPLFMVDLLRYLGDTQVIWRQGPEVKAEWSLAESITDLGRDLPESVRSLIAKKIDQLDQQDARLLFAASVQGVEFDSAVVSSAAGLTLAGTEERLDLLESVFALVRFVAAKEYPDGALTQRYRFVHVLYQNAFYGVLRPNRLVELSGAVAKAIRGHYPERSDQVAAELARLFETGRDFGPAADCYLQAAKQARRVSALKEAAALARRGLAALAFMPDSLERARRELKLQLILGPSLFLTEGLTGTEVSGCFDRARELCYLLEDRALLFSATRGLWSYYFVSAAYEHCLEMAKELLLIGTEAGGTLPLAGAHYCLGAVSNSMGSLAAARDHLAKALSLLELQDHQSHQAGNLIIYCYSERALTHWLMGYVEQSQRDIDLAQSLARQFQDPISSAHSRLFAIVCRQYAAENSSALLEEGTSLLGFCLDLGLGMEAAWLSPLVGWAMAETGARVEGINRIRSSIDALQSMGAYLSLPHYHLLLAEALAGAGQIDDAFAAIEKGLSTGERTQGLLYDSPLRRLKGDLLVKRRAGPPTETDIAESDVKQAEQCFLQGIEVARRQQAKSYELKAAISLASLYQQLGRPEPAHLLLEDLCAWFAEGLNTADLVRAKRILEETKVIKRRHGP